LLDSKIHLEGDNSKAVFSDVVHMYEPLIDSMVRKYGSRVFEQGVDADDLKQESLIALYGAYVTYKNTSQVSFGLYAKICIRNRLIDVLKKDRIHQIVEDSSFADDVDPEQYLIDKEEYNVLIDTIDGLLTPYEKSVFRMCLMGLSCREIALSLGRSVKSISNAIYRMRVKLKEHM